MEAKRQSVRNTSKRPPTSETGASERREAKNEKFQSMSDLKSLGVFYRGKFIRNVQVLENNEKYALGDESYLSVINTFP